MIRYAREYRLSPALLLAVMKAEFSFDPTVISKAGAVGLMQLIPETAIRHGVRNIFGTFWIVCTAIFGWHSRPTTLERRKSTGIGRFPRSKNPQSYVKKVMGYYRDYRSKAPDFLATTKSSVVYR